MNYASVPRRVKSIHADSHLAAAAAASANFISKPLLAQVPDMLLALKCFYSNLNRALLIYQIDAEIQQRWMAYFELFKISFSLWI